MKTILQVIILCALSIGLGLSAHARPIAYWPYEKLTAEADLIVIATPLAVRDTKETTSLPGIQRTGIDNVARPIPATGVETSFEVLSILKGDNSIKKFIFYHLREIEKQDVWINAPGLVPVDPKEKKRYLLFL
jgi:hypothetical protein